MEFTARVCQNQSHTESCSFQRLVEGFVILIFTPQVYISSPWPILKQTILSSALCCPAPGDLWCIFLVSPATPLTHTPVYLDWGQTSFALNKLIIITTDKPEHRTKECLKQFFKIKRKASF